MRRFGGMICRLVMISAVTLLKNGGYAGAQTSDLATKEAMQQIYGAMRTVLPLSLREDGFAKSENAKTITTALQTIAKNSGKLGTHAAPLNREYSFASRSLTRLVKDIERKFERGRKEEARYLFGHVTEACITCHSKIPEQQTFRADSLFTASDLSKLTPVEKASMLTATRQFDAAITAYEQLLVDSRQPVADLLLQGAITDYLFLVLRVKYNPGRAHATLAKMLQRQDLPGFIRRDLVAWNKALAALPKNQPTADLLTTARRVIKDAQQQLAYPLDRRAFVEYVYASGLLHKYIVGAKKESVDVAEAYYLLGLTEIVIGRSFWLSETEFYLETAVRLAPKAKFAPLAYSLLEEHAVLEYSGSSGVYLPKDVQDNLQQLQKLMNN